MQKLLIESLSDKKSKVDLKNEIIRFLDIKDTIKTDEQYVKEFKSAILDFGVDIKSLGVISSFNIQSNWEDITKELDKRQIEYYEFDLYDGESSILIKLEDFSEFNREEENL